MDWPYHLIWCGKHIAKNLVSEVLAEQVTVNLAWHIVEMVNLNESQVKLDQSNKNKVYETFNHDAMWKAVAHIHDFFLLIF